MKLAQYQFPAANWIVGGDFNMTESQDDRSPDYFETAMGRREQDAWTAFALSLGIGDVYYMDEFRRIGIKRHTWSRQKPNPQWSRLDRFYVNPALQELGGRHSIWQTMIHLSDHVGIFLQITLQESRTSA
jgi:endonuclease/exonuclease/phosphatase family metal-dependent hydrolase